MNCIETVLLHSRLRAVVSLAVLLLNGVATAIAAPVAVTNAGFESNVIGDGAFTVLVPTGWQMYDPSSIINQNANSVGVIRPNVPQAFFPAGAPEGSQAALVYLAGPVNAAAGLRQVLTTNLAADTRYTLTVQVGNIASGTSLPGSSDNGNVVYDLDGFPGYRLDLLAGGVLLASDNNSIGATIPEGEFRLATLIYDSNPSVLANQALEIRLVNLDLAGTVNDPNIEVDFDDVQLTAVPIPEPATSVLALSAVAILLLRRRMRRN